VIGDGNENPTTNKGVVEVEINGDLDITEHNEVESLTVSALATYKEDKDCSQYQHPING
jgi:hypothetical protein